MRSFGILNFIICLASLLAASPLQAQPPRGPSAERGPQQIRRGDEQPNSRGRQSSQQPPWVGIFDTDSDGVLSKSEIESGTASLWKLDRNNDGKISGNELRPSAGSPEPQSGRGQGGRGQSREFQSKDGAGKERSIGGRPSEGRAELRQQGRRGGDPAKSDSDFASQLMTLDANGNGVIEVVELPDHMHNEFKIADADNSESLSEKELLVLASKFRRNELNPDQTQQQQNAPTGGRQQRIGN